MPCGDGCYPHDGRTEEQRLQDTIRSAQRELNERTKAKDDKRKAIDKAMRDYPTDLFKGKRDCVFAIAEDSGGNGHDVEVVGMVTETGLREHVRNWLSRCRKMPSEMKFEMVKALGKWWLLSWHEHYED